MSNSTYSLVAQASPIHAAYLSDSLAARYPRLFSHRLFRQLRALVTLASTVQRWSDDSERAPGETSHADIHPESGVRRVRDGAELGRQAQGLLSEAESAGLDRERSNELRTLLTALSDEPSAAAGAQRGEWQRIAPKLHRLCSLLASFFEETPHSRAIAFVKRRSTVGALCAQLDVNPLTSKCVRAAAFVGQSARHDLGRSTAATGMDQAQQRQVLSDFSSGRFNVLVATSVAEEGLDVGECDLCICFDTVSSPIRLIQRFGRTGRKREGQCVLLLTSSEKQLYLDTMRRAQQLAAAVESGRGIELKRRAPSILAADTVAALVCRFYSTKETRKVCSSTAARKVDAGAIEKRGRSICSALKENQEPQFLVRLANRERVSRGGKRPLLHNHMQRERATPSSQVDLLSLCYSSDENEMDKPKAQRTPGSPVDNGEIHEKALSPHRDAQSAGPLDGNAPVQVCEGEEISFDANASSEVEGNSASAGRPDGDWKLVAPWDGNVLLGRSELDACQQGDLKRLPERVLPLLHCKQLMYL